jgi:hypothetical protein
LNRLPLFAGEWVTLKHKLSPLLYHGMPAVTTTSGRNTTLPVDFATTKEK